MILVLEDMPERVAWLRKRFPGANIVWHTTVTEFTAERELARMRKIEPLLVILDHDLGQDSCEANGADGLSGYEAAVQLRVNCPVLVWSMNGPAAGRMVRALIDTGHRTKHIPFLEITYPALVGYISKAIEP